MTADFVQLAIVVGPVDCCIVSETVDAFFGIAVIVIGRQVSDEEDLNLMLLLMLLLLFLLPSSILRTAAAAAELGERLASCGTSGAPQRPGSSLVVERGGG